MFFLGIALATWGLLWFKINFRAVFSICVEKKKSLPKINAGRSGIHRQRRASLPENVAFLSTFHGAPRARRGRPRAGAPRRRSWVCCRRYGFQSGPPCCALQCSDGAKAPAWPFAVLGPLPDRDGELPSLSFPTGCRPWAGADARCCLSGRLGASPIYCSARHHPKTWRLKTIIHIYYLTHLLSHSWEWLGWWLRLGCPLRSQLSERGFSSR